MKSSTAAQKNISNFSADVVKPKDDIYEFGSFRLDTSGMVLTNGGRPVPLKPKAFDLLHLLISEPERLFTKDEVMGRLWPETFVEEANLTQTVYELRRALGESARSPRFIRNVPKRGYRFSGRPRILKAPSYELKRSSDVASIAVLPFRNISPEQRDEYLELGIAETLATALSRLGKFTVRPLSAVLNFTETEDDPIAAGQQLGVDAILFGTIQYASGDRLRVSVRFERTDGGPALWAGTFDERTDDLFELQDSLLTKILESLSLKLNDAEMPNERPDPETHRWFLKCRYHWYKWTPENWKLSIEYGRRVTERDPQHADGYAWTAASYCTLGIFGFIPPAEAFETARDFINRSLEIDPSSSKAHEILAAIKLFYDWDWPALPNILKRTLDLDPGNATAHNLKALFDIANGRSEDALESIDRALAIDPLSLVSNTDRGFILLYAARFAEALEQFERTLQLDPYFAHAHYGLGYVRSALGDHAEALENMKSGVQFEGIDLKDSAEMGFAAALAGESATAISIAEEAQKKEAAGYYDPYRIALVFSGLRDRERSFDYLRRAVHNRSRELIYLSCHPAFVWLRNDDQFLRLLDAIGIEAK